MPWKAYHEWEVDRATNVKEVTFLVASKWFTAFVVLIDDQRNYWVQTLKDQ